MPSRKTFGFKDEAIAYQLKEMARRKLQAKTDLNHAKGAEVRLVKLNEALPKADVDENTGEVTVAPPVSGTVEHFGEGGSPLSDDPYDIKIYNTTTSSFQADEHIKVVRHREQWVALEKPSEVDASKRVKFVLNESLLSEGDLQSGFANATVIDPMSSDKLVGDNIEVFDYQVQFVTAVASAIGIAKLGDPFGDGEAWHIEEVEQLINRIEGTSADSLAAWHNVYPHTLTNIKPVSSWPYVTWLGGGGSEDVSVDAFNERGFSTIPCRVYCERIIPNTHLPQPNNQVCPYTLAPLDPFWTITNVELPVARWTETIYTNNTWVLKDTIGTGAGTWAEGQNPLLSSWFQAGVDAKPPKAIWDEIVAGGMDCMVKEGSAGWAFLDDNVGEYVTVMSASSAFGTPSKVAMVGKLDALSTDKLIDNATECGEIKHEQLINALVWGNADGSGSGCKMGGVNPLPTVDVFANAADVEVITGIQVDGNGDLELIKSTIKACDSPASPDTLALSQVDVVTDINCSTGGFQKSYKTIKYLGSELSSGAVVVDTSCIEIDYTNITFPTYPYIDYYDIIYPDGCSPCTEESGCCVLDVTDSANDEQIPNTSQAYCQSQYDNRDDVSGWSWNSGECTGCCVQWYVKNGQNYPTYDEVSKTICESRDNTGYIDPATGQTINQTYWYAECADLGCCVGGANNGAYDTQSNCVYHGGVWYSGEPCPTGCCVAPGEPVDGMIITEVVCDEYSGTWYQGQNCTGNSFGCCVISDSSNRELAVQSGLTDPECVTLRNNTPLAYSKSWTSGATCSDNSGCCVGGTYNEQQVLEGVCMNAGGTSWTQGPCTGGGGDDECDGSEVNSFYIQAGGGSCTATFTQGATATITGSSATVNGTWDLYDGVFPQLGVAGSVILTKSGNNWNVSADIDGAINTTVTGTTAGASPDMCAEGASGSVSGPPGNSPCNGTWNGNFTFSLSL